MSVFAVENGDSKWLEIEQNGSGHWYEKHGNFYFNWFAANDRARVFGGHVVELTKKPAPTVFPKWLDDWIQEYEDNFENEERARLRIIGKICQSGWGVTFNNQLNGATHDKWNPFDLDDGQLKYVHIHKDELVRALSLNSWQVEHPKRFNVKVPHTENSYYYDMGWGEGLKTQDMKRGERPAPGFREAQFTEYQLKQRGLGACQRIEVTEHD